MTEFLRATAKVASSFVIDGVRVRPGEEFRVGSMRTADTLVKLGLAERIEGQRETPALPTPKPPVVKTAPTESTPPHEQQKRKRGRPRKGEYLRRDMRAQE